MNDKNCPLKRLNNETTQAFDDFVVYAEMGYKDRSIDKAYLKATNQEETSKKSNHHWFKWSKEFNWQDRVREYDDWLFNEKQKEKIRLRKFIIDDIGDRLKDDIDRHLSLSEELTRHLEKLLKKEDMNPMIFKAFCAAHKDILLTRKEIYQMFLELTGINFLSEKIAKEEKKEYN